MLAKALDGVLDDMRGGVLRELAAAGGADATEAVERVWPSLISSIVPRRLREIDDA
jgi:hypothetical protein